MKAWLRNILEILAVIVLLPQVFVFFYSFDLFFVGGNRLRMLRDLTVYALAISWVSAPLLAVLVIVVKTLIRVRVRWYVTLLLCVASGYAWVAGWNLLVFKTFSYGKALIPVLLCSLLFAGYAAARMLYLESLTPLKLTPSPKPEADGAAVEPAKSAGPDLSE